MLTQTLQRIGLHAARPARVLRARQLPPRVRALVDAKEAESERLIGWVQLGVVLLFAMLFTLAPRPADAPMFMMDEPVPRALLVYALFTLGRLLLAYWRRLPAFIVVISIFADIALLLWLIWSFHEQYGQPAAFSLKVPTLIYIFLFIALRALRFDHRYVLVAGFAAALGWLALVYMVLDKSPDGVVTRSFVEYVNANRVLLGAEVEKVFNILLVAGLLAFAVQRARATLVTAVREEAAGREYKRFLAGGVADAISQAESEVEAGKAEERDAAIIMLDIRGFTGFSQGVPARDVVHMLTGLHARLMPIVSAHGGVVDKFLGDGVMITFGAVAPSETAAADGLRALEAIMQEARAWQDDLPASASRAGLAVNGAMVAGPVVFAALGHTDRLEYTVIGEAVNLAAKLEKHNKVARTRALVPRDSYARARTQGYQPKRRSADEVLDVRQKTEVAGVTTALDLVVVA
ncbi:MAG: adenylate/guanylate cyclase domain-containing protein [Pseudomonadota bacterium]